MTLQTQLVLRALLEELAKQRYGLELSDPVGLPSGTIYPILARLVQAGWVDSACEDPTAHEPTGRPRRRFDRLIPDGADQARGALAGRRPPDPYPTAASDQSSRAGQPGRAGTIGHRTHRGHHWAAVLLDRPVR